jgi:catechol 2,3-dioxygenase-like lactoylglutathione lyase family enzyme
MIIGLDHVVVGVPDLDDGIEWWASKTGVRPIPGGPHEGLGTRNALASLGDDLYLEIMSVDSAQDATSQARDWLAALDRPRPFGWCFRCDDAARTHTELEAAQVKAAKLTMRRARPDGREITWDLVFPLHELGPVIPFLIDWGSTPSPAVDAPRGCSLLDATPMHPEPELAQEKLDRMGIVAKVVEGPRSGPCLRFETPRGEVVVEP